MHSAVHGQTAKQSRSLYYKLRSTSSDFHCLENFFCVLLGRRFSYYSIFVAR